MCEIYPGEFEAMEHNGRMDAIEPSYKLSKKEIDTMLNALAEGEDFPEEQPVKDELISRQAVNDIICHEIGDFYLMRKVKWEIDKLPDMRPFTVEKTFEGTFEADLVDDDDGLFDVVGCRVPVTGKWIEKDGYDGDTYYDYAKRRSRKDQE